MPYLDWLIAGSEFHTAECKNSFVTIRPANQNEDCLIGFDNIVREAISNAHGEGYAVLPRGDWRRPGGHYAFASIYFTDGRQIS